MARLYRFDPDQKRHRLAAWESPITLRLAADADSDGLVRLAQLDSRSLPPGPLLVGEREGRIEAAISLATGEIIAEPFRRTVELCELLRCHAGELRVRVEPSPAAPPKPTPKLVMA
jgi:hypothetical protein